MYIVKINKDGYLLSPYFSDANATKTVSAEVYNMLSQNKIGYNWRFVNNTWISEELMHNNVLIERRQLECFNILDNRSKFWYDSLTNEQYQELHEWYQAWLDVTETKIIPAKPEWLK